MYFWPKMQWMICTMLHFVRSVSLDIWRIEWYVCLWPLWFSKSTISSTVITFSSVRVCFSLPISCRWSVLHVSKISVSNILILSLLQVILKKSASIFRKLYFFELVQVLNQSLVSTAKWHITSPVYLQCIKNYYLREYHLLMFKNIRNVYKTKHNLFF